MRRVLLFGDNPLPAANGPRRWIYQAAAKGKTLASIIPQPSRATHRGGEMQVRSRTVGRHQARHQRMSSAMQSKFDVSTG